MKRKIIEATIDSSISPYEFSGSIDSIISQLKVWKERGVTTIVINLVTPFSQL